MSNSQGYAITIKFIKLLSSLDIYLSEENCEWNNQLRWERICVKKKTFYEMKLKINFILAVAVLVVSASCAEELRKKSSLESLEMSNIFKLFSASTIQRCKAEDDDCITKAFNAGARKNGTSTLIQRTPKIHSSFFFFRYSRTKHSELG